MQTFGYNVIFTYSMNGSIFITSNMNVALKRKEQGYDVKRHITTEEGTYLWKWWSSIPPII